MSNGKGDAPRPLSVDPQTYADRYAATFAPRKVVPLAVTFDLLDPYTAPLSEVGPVRQAWMPDLSDPREALRQRNLAHARAIVCHDYPAPDAQA